MLKRDSRWFLESSLYPVRYPWTSKRPASVVGSSVVVVAAVQDIVGWRSEKLDCRPKRRSDRGSKAVMWFSRRTLLFAFRHSGETFFRVSNLFSSFLSVGKEL